MVEMSRRSLLGVFGLVAVAGATAACSSTSSSTSTTGASTTSSATGDALVFDPSADTEKTATISTIAGDKEVAYRLFSKIPYVAKPVDADYQSLTSRSRPGSTARTSTPPPRPSCSRSLSAATSRRRPPTTPWPAVARARRRPVGRCLPSGAMPSGTAAAAPSGAGRWLADRRGQHRPEHHRSPRGRLGGRLRRGPRPRPPERGRRVLRQSARRHRGSRGGLRYLRSNKGRIPGDPDKIVSDGTSAGGAVSALLGASGDSPMYDKYLSELGAADASDAILAVAAYCPITDLENADKAYEFVFGGLPVNGQCVDQAVSRELAAAFAGYQSSLNLKGLDGQALTSNRYQDYLLATCLQPAATTYLTGLSDQERSTYLSTNPWIQWAGGSATFTFADYLAHVGSRKKTEPAFDAFDLSAGENIEFGTASTNARHFTEYSRGKDTSATASAGLDSRSQSCSG